MDNLYIKDIGVLLDTAHRDTLCDAYMFFVAVPLDHVMTKIESSDLKRLFPDYSGTYTYTSEKVYLQFRLAAKIMHDDPIAWSYELIDRINVLEEAECA